MAKLWEREGCWGKGVPLLEQEGWLRHQEKDPFRSGADGVVAHTKCFAELTTPSAPFKGGFAAFS